jgi:hypothetical protein
MIFVPVAADFLLAQPPASLLPTESKPLALPKWFGRALALGHSSTEKFLETICD